jgi:hypothetical protein
MSALPWSAAGQTPITPVVPAGADARVLGLAGPQHGVVTGVRGAGQLDGDDLRRVGDDQVLRRRVAKLRVGGRHVQRRLAQLRQRAIDLGDVAIRSPWRLLAGAALAIALATTPQRGKRFKVNLGAPPSLLKGFCPVNLPPTEVKISCFDPDPNSRDQAGQRRSSLAGSSRQRRPHCNELNRLLPVQCSKKLGHSTSTEILHDFAIRVDRNEPVAAGRRGHPPHQNPP